MSLNIIVRLIILWTLFISCSDLKKSGEAESEGTTADSAWNTLLAKADSSWQIMMVSDDSKINNMLRLSEELLLLDHCDSSQLLLAQEKIKALPGIRYSRSSLGNPGIIDHYDSCTNQAINLLRTEIRRNGKANQFQIIMQLQEEILMADDSVLQYRKEYDMQAGQLNSILKAGKTADSTLEGLVNGRLPLFRLIP